MAEPSYSGKTLSELTMPEIELAIKDVEELKPETQREVAFLAIVRANLLCEMGRRKGLIK